MRFCTACHGAVSDTCGGMPSKVGLALFACFVAIVLLAEVPSSSPPEPQDFLKKQMAFTTLDLSAVESGHIVVKLPKTGETREVAAFAIMQLDVPVEFFLRGMRDIVHFKRSDNVLEIGKFSDPPRLEDLSGLTLDPEEIETIRHCRVSKCDFKLPARAIDRFREEVNWSAPDYPERVTALTRQMLLDHVTGYLQDGNTALGDYDDKPYKLRLADELDALLQPAPYMYGYRPEFQKYLQHFPRARPAQVESFVYWSKEAFGLKPVVSVTHVTVYRLSGAKGSDVLIASKGIYANHYLEASLGLTALIHSNSSALPRTYLVYVNRSRTDALRGLFAGLKRPLIGGRLRDGARKNMEVLRARLESEYVAATVDPVDPVASIPR